MPSTRGVVAVIVACALIAAAALWSNSQSNSPPYHYAPDATEARRLAARACAALDEFVARANANGPADEVMDLLRRFEAHAQAAYGRDVRWARLVSAAKALRAGFKADDANATRIGFDIARAECAADR